MVSSIVWGGVIILVFVLLRLWFRRRAYNALSPIHKAYRDWRDAFLENSDSDMETAGKALSELVISELTKETDWRILTRRYPGLVYWNDDTEKYGKDVIDFYNARVAELKTAERAETERLNARWKREQEAKEAACLQLAQEATTAKEAGAIYCSTPNSGPAEKLALEKWDRFSLHDVLQAKTAEEIMKAVGDARETSLAIKLAPFMHERLAKNEAGAADTIDAIIAAGENAPEETVPEHNALRIVFEKLYGRRNSITVIES